MRETTERPLVTFAVIAYNQERFIREAIEGAFAQTYQPLEIILSDDCSPDRTYDIMQEMAAAYDGPHRVVLNRNEPNLGLVQHVNKVFDLASGKFICVNAGDDFSRNDRVAFLMNEWRRHGGRHSLVHTSAFEIDKESQKLGILRPHKDVMVTDPDLALVARSMKNGIGATAFYSKELFKVFGPIQDFAEIEDRPMFFRSALVGGILFVDEPLVFYRYGGISDSKGETMSEKFLFSGRQKILSWKISNMRCHLADLETLGGCQEEALRRHLERSIQDGQWELRLSKASLGKKLKLLVEVLRETLKERRFSVLKSYLKYLLWPMSLVFYTIREKCLAVKLFNGKFVLLR